MNDNTGGSGGRQGWARAGVLAATGVGIALLVAACGGGGSPTGAGPASGQTPYQQALAYAQCMRSHGEPNFPDPTSQGLITFGSVNIHSSQYLSANKTCQHLLSQGSPLTAAQKQEHVSQALKFSACMRSHGVPSFPDPLVAQGGKAVGFRMSGVDRNSPQFQAAVQACRKFEPGMAGLMAGGRTP
jgi:hypothetical protein